MIVVKPDKAAPRKLAETIRVWLLARGCCPVVVNAGMIEAGHKKTSWALIIALGGDGTILGVARRFCGHSSPVLGINFGRVGYLAGTLPEDWCETLEAILAGKGVIHPHTALHWVVRRGTQSFNGAAFNDIAIGRGAMSRVSTIDLFADDEPVCQLRADGVIFSTPMGSTAYTLSAGGPLLHPAVEALVVTPICPFLYKMPPLVMPLSAVLKAVMHEGVETYLTADGQDGFALEPGDEVCVHGVPGGVLLALAKKDNYFERLARCGFVGKLPDAPEKA